MQTVIYRSFIRLIYNLSLYFQKAELVRNNIIHTHTYIYIYLYSHTFIYMYVTRYPTIPCNNV